MANHLSRTVDTTLPAFGASAVLLQVLLVGVAAFVMPAAAHAAGVPVRVFLPMHWPVILAGLVYGWRSGLLVGAAAPLVSFAVSGMPPVFILPAMTAELAMYGLAAGLLRERFKLNAFLATAAALIAGRIVYVAFAIGTGTNGTPIGEYLAAALLPGAAAAIAQLLILPIAANGWVRLGRSR